MPASDPFDLYAKKDELGASPSSSPPTHLPPSSRKKKKKKVAKAVWLDEPSPEVLPEPDSCLEPAEHAVKLVEPKDEHEVGLGKDKMGEVEGNQDLVETTTEQAPASPQTCDESPRAVLLPPSDAPARTRTPSPPGIDRPSTPPSMMHPVSPLRSPYRDRSDSDTTSSRTRRTSNFTSERLQSTIQPSSSRSPHVLPVRPTNAVPTSLLQPHFFSSIQNQNFYSSTKQKPTTKAWWTESCYLFDSFAGSGDVISATKAKDALLIGGDGSLDVYRVLSNKMEVVGRLEGLAGVVVDAKILPSVAIQDREDQSLPLVAVVLYTIVAGIDADSNPKLQAYVQVFSLRTQTLVATLFSSLATPAPEALAKAGADPPDVLGGLRIHAAGPYITVSSAVSGEVHVFRHELDTSGNHDFRCITKFWTSVRSPHSSMGKPGPTASESVKEQDQGRSVPLMALGDRWLIISCPNSSSKLSIQGTPLVDATKAIGLNSHNPPLQPSTTAETLAVNAEGVLSKYTRQAAQELLKASKKGIELGLAGLREFTNPTQPEQRSTQTTSDSDAPGFPPTHAAAGDTLRLEQEPAVISIIDLERFSYITGPSSKPSQACAATFAIDDGCSFMSLSNDGLSLLTANRSGEISTVWDLSNAFYSSLMVGNGLGDEVTIPFVKCAHRMQRNSPCVVVAVTWSQADTEIAIQTANGTTHLHHLPRTDQRGNATRASGLMRRERSDSKSGVGKSTTPGSSPPVYGMFDSLRNGWSTVSTQMQAIRNSSTATQPFDISSTFAGLRASSGRVLAKGLASGYSAAKTGVGDMWHADENKIRSGEGLTFGTFHWVQTTDSLCLAVAQGDKLSLYTILRATRMRGKTEFVSLKVEKGSRMDFVLPSTSPTSSEACSKEGPHGFWSLRQLAHDNGGITRPSQPAAEPEVDVITNPLFCPFHVDQRVSMMVYSADAEDQMQAQLNHGSFWSFGQPFPPSVKINKDSTALADLISYDGVADAMYESRVTVHPVSQEITVRSHILKEPDIDLMD